MKISLNDIRGSMVHVVYHKNCLDGLVAACLMRRALNKIGAFFELEACQYGGEHKLNIPNDRIVVFVDFSLKKELMKTVIEKSKHVLVYDHHITAFDELEKLPHEYGNFELFFDNEVCGSEVTFKNFIKANNIDIKINQNFINYVTDWDLFKFKLEKTVGLRSYLEYLTNKNDLDKMDPVLDMSETELNGMIYDGEVISKFVWKAAEKVSKSLEKDGNPRTININNYKLAVVNSAANNSEIGNQICEDWGVVSLMYFIIKDTVICNLRSKDELVDATKIAKFFGGGGHRNACGFQLPLSSLSLLINNKLNDVYRIPAVVNIDGELVNGWYFINDGIPFSYYFNGRSYNMVNGLDKRKIDYTKAEKLI